MTKVEGFKKLDVRLVKLHLEHPLLFDLIAALIGVVLFVAGLALNWLLEQAAKFLSH
jgi:hypothetical protein